MMKAREAALRLKQFEADEKARKVGELEQMIREFENMAMDLQRQVDAEEERTGVRDSTHFAYSTFARSAAQRRENLLVSLASLQAQLDAAVAARDEAFAELDEADPMRQRATNEEHAEESLLSR
ncbi:MAG: flagellar export protein FliJ [Pseudomonadota bacterium]